MKAKAALGAGSALILTLVTLVVSFVLVRLIVSHLNPEQSGFWFLLLSVAQFILFFDLGFSPTLTRRIAMTLGNGQIPQDSGRIIGETISSLRLALFGLAAAIFAVAVPIGIFFFPTWFHLTQFPVDVWIIFLVGAVVNLVGGVNFAALNGMGDVASERLLRAAGQLTWLGFSFLTLYFGYGLLGLALAWTAQGVLVRAAAGIMLRRRYPTIFGETYSRNFAHLHEMWAPSVKWAITSLGALLILQTGNFVIASVLGATAVPPYEALNRMLAALMTFGILVATASSPFISRAFAEEKAESMQHLVFMNARVGLGLVVGAAVFLAFHGRAIVSLWLGPELFPAPATLSFGIAMAVLEVHHVILATAVMATGPVPFASWAVGAGILNLVFGFLLVPRFGLPGMAASTFLAQALTNNWYAPAYAFRRLDIRISIYTRQVLTRIFVTAILFTALATVLNLAFHDSNIGGLISQAALYSVFGTLIFYFAILESDERNSVRSWVTAKVMA